MANTKKPRLLRKKVKSYSITTQVVEDFNEICKIKGLTPSNEIEKMIQKFNTNYNKV